MQFDHHLGACNDCTMKNKKSAGWVAVRVMPLLFEPLFNASVENIKPVFHFSTQQVESYKVSLL